MAELVASGEIPLAATSTTTTPSAWW